MPYSWIVITLIAHVHLLCAIASARAILLAELTTNVCPLQRPACQLKVVYIVDQTMALIGP